MVEVDEVKVEWRKNEINGRKNSLEIERKSMIMHGVFVLKSGSGQNHGSASLFFLTWKEKILPFHFQISHWERTSQCAGAAPMCYWPPHALANGIIYTAYS